MRDKIIIGIVSMVAGAMLMSIAPVQAHHNDYNLKQRVKRLENKMANVEYITYQCLYAVGVSQYDGYLWEDFYGNVYEETALDFDPEFDPNEWMMVAEPSCVSTSSQQGVFKQLPDGKQVPKRRHP